MSVRVIVVPHTHWDREWYRPAAALQLRLARLVDEVCALLEADPGLPGFLLDGQGIVLDDYAAIRPDGVAAVTRWLRAGRLEAGPWYVLPDELLVSAEALVRNLLAGTRTVRRFGGEPPRVGYSPDAFGHSGSLPAILRGFGIEAAVVWRGFGDAAAAGDLFRWRSPDGSVVLLIHLPPAGYEGGANLPADPAAARVRWREIAAALGPRARSPWWLLLNGADHHAPQRDLRPALTALAAAAAPDGASVAPGRLADYVAGVSAWAARASLPEAVGELRAGWAHAWALQDTHGTRLWIKQWNAYAQRLLERVAEPLGALAVHRGAALRVELHAAWRTLLENHPHDSLCGTSTDEVHREMATRFRRAVSHGGEVVDRALDIVTQRDPNAARVAGRAAWRPGLVVFQPLAVRGPALVEAEVALPVAPLAVGPGSHRVRAPRRTPGVPVLRDGAGRSLPLQRLEARPGLDRLEPSRHYPMTDAVVWHRVLVAVPELPPLGVMVLGVEEARQAARAATRGSVRVTDAGLENDLVWVRVEHDGTFALADKRTGLSCHGLGQLVVETDRGDSYTSSVPRGAPVITMPDAVAVRVRHAGPLRGELEVVRRFAATSHRVAMRLVLDAGAACVTVRVAGVNRRTDQRLRMAFPLGRRAARVVADGHFGAVERAPGRPPRLRGAKETPAATAPCQRWVAVAGGDEALAVVSDGLPQYEARRDGTLLVTLLRSHGELSRADLPERPGHAGWPVRTPEGQCLGPFAATLAVALIAPGALDTPDTIDALADTVLVRPWARMTRAMLSHPEVQNGPELSGAGLVFSAMKPAESGEGIVLRCYNARGQATTGAWRLPWPVTAAQRCRLDETPTETLAVAGGGVAFAAGPREIVTVLVR